MRDVGDVDAEPVVAVLQPLDRDRVVEVARVLAVDGDRHLGPEVGPAGEVLLANLGAELARFLDGLLAVRVGDAVLADDDFGVDARRVDVADDLDDLADRAAGGRRPSRDRGRDHVVRLRVALVARRNLDVHDQPAIERDDEAAAGAVGLEAADDRRRAALEDPQDAAFRALVRHALDARDDAVAVHGLIQIAAGDVDVAGDTLDGTIGHDEAEPARVRRDPPDDQVHSIGQTVAVAARLDERPGAGELLEQPLERRALLARYLQPLEQLSRRRRVLDFVANQLEQLFVVQHAFILAVRWPRGTNWVPGDTKVTVTGRPPAQLRVNIALPRVQNLQPPLLCLSLLTV